MKFILNEYGKAYGQTWYHCCTPLVVKFISLKSNEESEVNGQLSMYLKSQRVFDYKRNLYYNTYDALRSDI